MDDPQWWRFRLRSGSTMPADSSFCCKQAKVPNAGHSNRLILLTNCCYRLIRSVCTEYSTRIIKGITMSLNNTFRVYSSFLPTRVKIRPRCFPSQFLGPITLYPGILANRGASTTPPPTSIPVVLLAPIVITLLCTLNLPAYLLSCAFCAYGISLGTAMILLPPLPQSGTTPKDPDLFLCRQALVSNRGTLF